MGEVFRRMPRKRDDLLVDLCHRFFDGCGRIYIDPIIQLRKGLAKFEKKTCNFRVVASFVYDDLVLSAPLHHKTGHVRIRTIKNIDKVSYATDP